CSSPTSAGVPRDSRSWSNTGSSRQSSLVNFTSSGAISSSASSSAELSESERRLPHIITNERPSAILLSILQRETSGSGVSRDSISTRRGSNAGGRISREPSSSSGSSTVNPGALL